MQWVKSAVWSGHEAKCQICAAGFCLVLFQGSYEALNMLLPVTFYFYRKAGEFKVGMNRIRRVQITHSYVLTTVQ